MPKDSKTAEQPLLNGLPKSWPPLTLRREIPAEVSHREIEDAVRAFQSEVPTNGNATGFFNQTLELIAHSTFLRAQGSANDFWLVQDGVKCVGYVLASISKDIDNQLCYWISQCWLDKKYRGTGAVKDYWETLRQHALKSFCRHIIIVSGRGDRAYQRLLGGGLHIYATLIKQDI